MSNSLPLNVFEQHHEKDALDKLIQKLSLEITVVGADPTQQRFIEEAISYRYNLKFLSVTSPRAAICSGTLPEKGLLLFLVPAESRGALRQIRIMKWIRARQPCLNLVPLISEKAIWNNMRESLAKDFPIYLPINFTNTIDCFSYRLLDRTGHLFSQIFDVLAGIAFGSESLQNKPKVKGRMRPREGVPNFV